MSKFESKFDELVINDFDKIKEKLLKIEVINGDEWEFVNDIIRVFETEEDVYVDTVEDHTRKLFNSGYDYDYKYSVYTDKSEYHLYVYRTGDKVDGVYFR